MCLVDDHVASCTQTTTVSQELKAKATKFAAESKAAAKVCFQVLKGTFVTTLAKKEKGEFQNRKNP